MTFTCPIFFIPGTMCNCIVQLKSKNTKTPLSSNVSFFYSRGIEVILLCITRQNDENSPKQISNDK